MKTLWRKVKTRNKPVVGPSLHFRERNTEAADDYIQVSKQDLSINAMTGSIHTMLQLLCFPL